MNQNKLEEAYREIVWLREQFVELKQELHDAGDGDTWREACVRCEVKIRQLELALEACDHQRIEANAEIERLREHERYLEDQNLIGKGIVSEQHAEIERLQTELAMATDAARPSRTRRKLSDRPFYSPDENIF